MAEELLAHVPRIGRTPAERDAVSLRAARIDEAILQQCRRTPDRIALSFGADDWTYAQLELFILRVGAAVASTAIGHNPVVGVCFPRSNEMVGCLIGVMAAGAAYLPLDPDLPPARLAQILEDAGPALVLGTTEALAALPPVACATLSLDDVPPIFLAADQDEYRQHSDRDLAYVIYTSGSTGRPKGVEIEHRSVLALVDVTARLPGFDANDTLIAVTRMTFDMSVLDYFLPLMLGGRLVLTSFEVAADPRRLGAAILECGATVMQATPTTWRALLEAGWPGSSKLRILCGGEAMTADLATRLLPRCRELWNMFGPTETTVWSTAYRVEQPEPVMPIGLALPGEGAHVLDADAQPLAPGETGELYLSGIGLARGYRGQPDLTAARFVDLKDVGRAYRTGDLASMSEDGLLRCHGRADDQVKVRGYRVELGEIENVLSGHPDVAWCAVRCWPDGLGETGLFGYVVHREGSASGDLVAYLRARLPAYMVPQHIFPIPVMPLSSNGKIDRGALPPPDSMTIDPLRLVERPASLDDLTPTERTLVAIWNELLPVPVTARSDDFFDMGGYSLMTVRLLCQIEESCGAALTLPDVLQNSSLSAMAAIIDAQDGSPGDVALFPLQPHGDAPPLIWLDAGSLLRDVHRQVDQRYPIVGLNLGAGDVESLLTSDFTLNDVAAIMAGHIQRLVPSGPILLGGWCKWGVVAWEVAQHLWRDGREMRLLVLLDADRPGFGARPSARERLAHAKRRLLFRPAAREASLGERIERLCERYRPAPYDGEVALLLAQDRPEQAPADCGWAALVRGPLTILRSRGDHESMVRAPQSFELAACISRVLCNVADDAHKAHLSGPGAAAGTFSGGTFPDRL
jgi:amino acid adenylation domain-containing protein